MRKRFLFIGLIVSMLIFSLPYAVDAYWLTKVRKWKIEESTIDSTTVGATTPSTGSFTTLGASGAVTLGGAFTLTDDFAQTGTGTFSTGTGTVSLNGDTVLAVGKSLGLSGAGYIQSFYANIYAFRANDGTDSFTIADSTGDVTIAKALNVTGTLTANGTLDANGIFALGDGGEAGSVNTDDWDISVLGVMTGFSFDADGTGNSITNVDLSADVTGVCPVPNGGSGANSLTNGGILLGSGAGPITAMAVLGDGAIVVGNGLTDPVVLAAFSSSTGILKVAYGGTNAASLTDHSVLLGSGATDPITALTVGGDNEILCGAAGADPSFRALVDADVPAILTLAGSTIDSSAIGGSTPSTGAFTTLGATGLVTLSGSPATGVSFAGTYSSHALDFSSTTQAAGDISLIRAGSYGAPMDVAGEDQYGMVRLCLDTDDDGASYNRGVFVCLKTTGTKGIFPIAGLAEVLEQSGAGPANAGASQFISGLHTATSKLATSAGGATAGMYGSWLKIYSAVGSEAAAGSRVCPLWVDNQMSGTVSGEEYGIYATTGGTRPDGLIGLRTTSSGYDQFIYADATFNSGAGTCMTTDAVPGNQDARIKVWYDGKQYYIPLYR